MTTKTTKQHLFITDMNWESERKGVISSQLTRNSIRVSAPLNFGGEEGEWSPEHLFLGSISSCFMTTFLVFVEKIKFEIFGFECTATGQVEVVDGKYKFTFIHLYPKVYTKSIADKEKALIAMEKAKKYCLVSNSVNAEIIYHMETEVKEEAEKINVKKINYERHHHI